MNNQKSNPIDIYIAARSLSAEQRAILLKEAIPEIEGLVHQCLLLMYDKARLEGALHTAKVELANLLHPTGYESLAEFAAHTQSMDMADETVRDIRLSLDLINDQLNLLAKRIGLALPVDTWFRYSPKQGAPAATAYMITSSHKVEGNRGDGVNWSIKFTDWERVAPSK